MVKNSSASEPNNDWPLLLEQSVRCEQVRLLYANTALAVTVTTIGAGVLSYLQWNVISHSVVTGWLAYMIAVSTGRFVISRLYHTWARHPQNAGRPAKAFLLGTVLSAAGWGGAGILLYPEVHLVNQVFLAFVLGGMMVGGASVLAARIETFAVFILVTGIPTSIRMLVQADEVHRAMGLLAALYTVATLITAWHVHRTILSALRLRFENESLLVSLLAAKGRAEALSQKLITTRDDECRRVSHELHDGLNQTIGTLLIDAQLLQPKLPSNPDCSAQLQLMRTHITDLADDLRRIMHQLHPTVLERMGLVAALQLLCTELYDREKLCVRFRPFNVPDLIPPHVALCIYRVAHEGLQNVVKHSESRRAAVVLVGG